MKKSVSYVAILFLLLSFTASFSHSSDLIKKRNTGILVVKTWDTDWNKLGNVSLTLDDKEYKEKRPHSFMDFDKLKEGDFIKIKGQMKI